MLLIFTPRTVSPEIRLAEASNNELRWGALTSFQTQHLERLPNVDRDITTLRLRLALLRPESF
ncbi:hypothetical protein [Mesorhizobium sp. L-2-11]|uniref:hypothetical protein n=1 Tax=Mesorhizobium sp. L-2-11 TaxID=2744521 RepID=UPI001928326B|nr:hypothetical protein [Mesorhizobium sp. L-2-11]BCH19827.1 hypothetical protein MesoLjLa_66780 [Mesorhizobium sp. L-2-11]